MHISQFCPITFQPSAFGVLSKCRYLNFAQTHNFKRFVTLYAKSSPANTNSPTVIAFDSIKHLLQQEAMIQIQFRKFGYLILSGPTDKRELLFNVARLFGKIQGHERSPHDGLVDVKSHYSDPTDTQVNSKLPFFAHTDGHYLEGMAQQNDSVVRVTPPKIILLQCVKAAEEGGESFLVDARAILSNLREKRSPLLKTLFHRRCTSICRNKHLITDVPVFEERPSGRFSIRFSYDQDLYAPSWAKHDLNLFNQKYILDPTFVKTFPLSSRQILVIDNHRHLHGRTEVKGERLFRRIWVQDEACSSHLFSLQQDNVPYYGSTINMFEACAHYQPYTAISETPGDRFKEIITGIELP